MKEHFKDTHQTWVGFNGGLAAVFGLLAGCQAPCMSGFERKADGVCYATSPCGPGEARGEDLLCHPQSGSAGDTAAGELQPDSGEPEVDPDTGSGDSGGTSEGPGRIQVQYPGLSGYPAHGFIVFASPEGMDTATAAFCQIILAAEVDVDGYLQAYDGESDPCPSFDEAMYFDPGPVELNLMVASGAGADSVLCDVRTVHVLGDITVDFSGVTTCDD